MPRPCVYFQQTDDARYLFHFQHVGRQLPSSTFFIAFLRRSEWANLGSCKASYKRKRVLDRRFDGPKNRRTRDFDDASLSGFGFGFGGLW